MISFPNAKINLGLNVLNKRTDGYHNVVSCLYPIPWHDSLEIIEAKSFSFHTYGLEVPGDKGSNLCVKAYDLLRADFKIPSVEIHLLKAIPMGAGLGGGSADGAFTLKMLNEISNLKLSNHQLQDYALQLGSDCPFFIENKPVIAEGRGEQFESIHLDLAECFLAIHNPGIHVSTQEAYSEVNPAKPKVAIKKTLSSPIPEWKGLLQNDFEKSILKNHPEVEKLKVEMYEEGAIYASMTGSGSTVFGIFEEEPKGKWKVLKF